MRKFVKIALILLIGIIATFYYIKAIDKRTAKDDVGVVKIASSLTAGTDRNEVTNVLSASSFKLNQKSPSVKDPKNRQIFFKISSKSTFAWVRYDALIEYDGKDLVKTARFLKSNHSDGKDTSCVILHEVPSRNVTYPAQCSPDVHDF
jgi:hypothetical protein